MKVLVITLDAQLRAGLEKQLTLRNRPYQCVGVEWFRAIDPVDVQRSPSTIPADVGVVVNALTLECLEQQIDENLGDGLLMLAQACSQRGIPLIQLSNSRVFDGIDGGRHRERDAVVPASRIGAILSRMEELVRSACPQHIILRTGPLFSAVGDNLLTSLLQRFQDRESLTLSSSGKSSPVHVLDLARVISAIVDQLSCGAQCWGTYHYCSSDPASSHQFAETVLAVASQYIQGSDQPLMLEPVATADTSWPRPLLNCDEIFNNFGIKQLPWRSYVAPTVKEVYQQQSMEKVNGQ